MLRNRIVGYNEIVLMSEVINFLRGFLGEYVRIFRNISDVVGFIRKLDDYFGLILFFDRFYGEFFFMV